MSSSNIFVCHCGKSYSGIKQCKESMGAILPHADLATWGFVHRWSRPLIEPIQPQAPRFVCPDQHCAKTFSRPDLRNKHLKAIHPNLATTDRNLIPTKTNSPSSQSSPLAMTEAESSHNTQNHDEPAPKRTRFTGGQSEVGSPVPTDSMGPTVASQTATFAHNQHSDVGLQPIDGEADSLSDFLTLPSTSEVDRFAPYVSLPVSEAAGTTWPNVPSAHHDSLVLHALGLDLAAPTELISGGNDIPWIHEYSWLIDEGNEIGRLDPPAMVQSAQPTQSSSLNDPASTDQQPARALEYLDSNMVLAMLQDIRPRTPTVYDAFTSRFGGPTSHPQAGQSRAASPSEDMPVEDDPWPMNWRHPAPPKQALGGSNSFVHDLVLQEVTPPSLHKWKDCWIDEATYEKVKKCFALAEAMPGSDVRKFRMPRSLAVVNTCISLYFEHLHPQFPVMHLPTFQPSRAPPLLLAGLICVGACYSNLKGARELALDLIDVIRKTLNALFEHDARNLRMVAFIHVYFLVVVAGLFIGNKRTYELAEASRGTLINLCRRSELLDSRSSAPPESNRADIESRWNQWVTYESRKRLGIAICLLDTIFPALLDIPAYHSHRDMINLAMPCEDQFWTAPTAHAWAGQLGLSPAPPSPFFKDCIVPLLLPHFSESKNRAAYTPIYYLNSFASTVVCSSLHHHLYEFRTHLSYYLAGGLKVSLLDDQNYYRDIGSGFEGRREWLREALDTWNRLYGKGPDSFHRDSGNVLYHLGHVSLHVYVGGLYDAIGKRGSQAALVALRDVQAWTQGDEAPIALEHSLAIIEHIHTLERSVYYPLAAFVAVLSLWGFFKFVPADKAPQTIMQDPRLIRFLAGCQPTSAIVLGKGAELLAKGIAWRLGAALALLLVQQVEKELS